MRDGWRRSSVWVLLTAAVGAAGCGGGSGGATGSAGATSSGSAGATSSGSAGATGTAGGGGAGGHAGAGGAVDGGQMDGPRPVADPAFMPFCTAARAELTNHFDRCQGIAPEAGKFIIPRDPCLWWGAAVSGGRMTFDSTNADACIAALKAAPCDADSVPAICDRALTGALKVGGVCSMAAELLLFSECETGDACIAGPTGCEGTCVARVLLTKPCGIGAPCLQGESCSVLGSGTCEPKAGMGEACGFSTVACQTGFFCTDLFNGGTCMPREGMGGACGISEDACQAPLTCDTGGNINGGTCKTAPRPGAACDPTSFTFTCSAGFLTCGDDSKCHAEPGLGESCATATGDLIPCGAGICDNTVAKPICKAQLAMGACSVESDCAPSSLCVTNFTGSTCTAACVPR